jgi:hypothetical protein
MYEAVKTTMHPAMELTVAGWSKKMQERMTSTMLLMTVAKHCGKMKRKKEKGKRKKEL